MKNLSRILPFLFPLLFSPDSLFAWGEKGHAIANEAATFATPTSLPAFFHKAYPALVYLSLQPDRWKGQGDSLEAENFPNHFLDYEYVEGFELPRSRYELIDLMIEKGGYRSRGISTATPGFLPWKIAEMCQTLAHEWKIWRTTNDRTEKQQVEQNIIFLAGNLGHYVADAANPHHATFNYNGWVEENPEGFRNDCDTHRRFETSFINRAIELHDVLPHVGTLPGSPVKDYFAASIALVRESNSLVKPLYRIDRDGGFDGLKGSDEARLFAARRIAAGATLLRDLWWSTYDNSSRP